MAIPFLLPVAALLGANLSLPSQESLSPFQALEERGTAETFLVMMQLTGLRATLEASDAPYTLLPPVDTAFIGVPPEVTARLLGDSQRGALRDLLNDHVLLGSYQSEDFVALDSVSARSGLDLPVGIQGGRLTLRGVPIAAQAATTSFTVQGGAVLEMEGLILEEPSLLELTRARRLAVRGLRLASELPQEGEAAMAAQSAVLEMSLAAALECAGEAEQALLGPVPSSADSLSTAERVAQLRAPLLRLLGRPSDTLDPSASNLNMTSMNAPKDDSRMLVPFDGTDAEPDWYTLNDDVMGGISTSSVEIADGRLLFQGALSLENNGGFASIRSRADDYDFSGMTGLRLRVRTDGREYGANVLAGDQRGRVGSWRKRFQVPAGEWTTVEVPFKDMVLSVRGREYPEVGPPDLAAVRSFSFIIGDKDTTPFQLEIDSISTYR